MLKSRPETPNEGGRRTFPHRGVQRGGEMPGLRTQQLSVLDAKRMVCHQCWWPVGVESRSWAL